MQIEDQIRDKAEFLLENQRTMHHHLGIRFLVLTRRQVQAVMPVNDRTLQPMGILHGGASAALAETIMSVGAWLNIPDDDRVAVGLEINANHLRPVPEGGRVTGIAKPVHIGRTTQVWEAKMSDGDGKLVCISRCTLAVVPAG